MGANLLLLLLTSALLSTAACSARAENPSLAPLSAGLVAAARPRPVAPMRVALALPIESGEGAVAKDQLGADEATMPDIAGPWTGVWSGFGVMSRRVSMARAELSQSGPWGWGQIGRSGTLPPDVPAMVTYRGAPAGPVEV